MHKGVGLVGRGDLFLGDGQDEVHVQHLGVKLDFFLGMLAAIDDMVNLVDLQ